MRARQMSRSGPGSEALKGTVVPSDTTPGEAHVPDDSAPGDDPMPAHIEPCLASAAAKPPRGSSWSFEVEWEGYRLAVHIEPSREVRLLTRDGRDWTTRFPAIVAAAKQIVVDSAILDGEAVILDRSGKSDFLALQQALGGREGKDSAEFATLFAFDILYLNGQDLRHLPLSQRREILADAIDSAPPGILLSEDVIADGEAFYTLACKLGLEGIIAKRLDAPYRSGRGGEWLKIKCIQSETFAIVGYEPSVGYGGIGRLLLAAAKADGLVYVGGAGNGWTDAAGAALKTRLDARFVPRPPIATQRTGVRWVSPVLAAEIEFRGWTDDGKLRHATYKGLRDEADAAKILQLGEA
ncbi:DNA ligase D precursor [Bosea sp. LC85]|uniref:non-homologous end-joining DNA ligase n=1 Tax=Bosea sp. LC85 TaxID=1502851 RepID=UPI0004E30937|nr:non-homologous end-joining DNA ligase [Bosea sp. LC85]KFC72769.1 DNA ligase D precursor [Bosea sp. LC85]